MASAWAEKSAMVGAAPELADAYSETAKAKPKRQEFARDMSPSQDVQTTADTSGKRRYRGIATRSGQVCRHMIYLP
jgi:hypothetical protein